YAAQVRAKLQEDDYSGAAYCSQKAKKWAVIGFALGLMSIIIYFMVEGFKY
ncbi:MAG: CD225/dispanin family protein, partial [Elusimicrobiota bacterium]